MRTHEDTTRKKWFPFWRPNLEARLRLFCFRFAGGGPPHSLTAGRRCWSPGWLLLAAGAPPPPHRSRLLYALPEAEFIDFTMGDFSLRIVPGGHFFLNSPDGRLLREVEGTLLPWCG